ncbi:ABC transporter ATP-binding protein, partial [Alphaproteobacteria bacterium]|nr:ABC transporter ATP-binding protein [Alphaproteobacteria bacterium]
SCEKQIETLNAEKQQIERQMAAPDFYHQSNSEAIAELSRQLAGIEAQLAAVEEAWLQHQEELEQLA